MRQSRLVIECNGVVVINWPPVVSLAGWCLGPKASRAQIGGPFVRSPSPLFPSFIHCHTGRGRPDPLTCSAARREESAKEAKMIYHNWSLLSSTVVIWGGVATAGLAGIFLFGGKVVL
jgi:hypothetical protein